jgi:hypothetical protein
MRVRPVVVTQDLAPQCIHPGSAAVEFLAADVEMELTASEPAHQTASRRVALEHHRPDA